VSGLVLHTYDWVPEPPRGFVRDLRVRWALEEAGLPYEVASVPFRTRGAEHFAHQPFGHGWSTASYRSSRTAPSCCTWASAARR
jgi:hypothetical protein